MNHDLEVRDPDELCLGWAVYGAARDVDGPVAFSHDWHELPVDDVRRRAALVRGAWYWHCAEQGLAHPAGQQRFDELVEREVSRELRVASHAVAAAEDWSAAGQSLLAGRSARRRRAEALRPRPNDYQGGRVDWVTGRPVAQVSDVAA